MELVVVQLEDQLVEEGGITEVEVEEIMQQPEVEDLLIFEESKME
jgi:hypothetical protein